MAARAPPTQKGVVAQNVGAPNQTLYIKNLNEKINKNELKRALYMLFSSYGPVLDIVTTREGSKGQSMRGQAHVVFRDIQTSTQAMRALQSFDFLGKELNIAYGKGQSQIIPKLRGTMEPSAAIVTGTGTESTALQKSIFDAPTSTIPPKPIGNGVLATDVASHGVKRPREDEPEEEDDQDDAPMDEDEGDASMEEDDDDD